MRSLTRRTFLGVGAAGPLLAASGNHAPLNASFQPKRVEPVYFAGDGLPLGPTEYAELLGKLSKEGRAKPDSYLADGCVAELEKTIRTTAW